MKVLCHMSSCLHWRKFDSPQILMYHKSYVPLGDDDLYSGYCARDIVGIRERNIETLQVKHHLAVCRTYSDKRIKGHMDFSRYPQGGHIPD